MPKRPQNVRPEIYLKEIGADLDLLYVEDDTTIQLTFLTILKRFFNKVDVANNGAQGLEMLKSHPYDLVVSDIMMPVMNGIEMIKEAYDLGVIEKTIVTSAHSESDKIIQLINLGVDGFILKPIDIEQLLAQLIRVCEPIHEHKMLDYYLKELEVANEELRAVNEQIEIMLQGLESHPDAQTIKETMVQAPNLTPTLKATLGLDQEDFLDFSSSDHDLSRPLKSEAMSAHTFHTTYPIELGKKNEDLENIEDDYDMLLAKSADTQSSELLRKLTQIIRDYAQAIETIPEFTPLAIGIEELANTFGSIEDSDVLERLMPMISSLFDTLHRWRVAVFVQKNVDDVHYLDDSIISDAQALKSLLGFSAPPLKDEAEFDLF